MAATIGKVSAVFSASTAGLRSGVNDAVSSFRRLGGEAGTLKTLFASMQAVASKGVGEAGPAADMAASSLGRFQRLAALAQESLAAGRITAEQFAAKMNLIGEAAERVSAAVSRGAEITARFTSDADKSAAAVAELNHLLAEGAITQEIHARAMAEATGAAAGERAELEAAARQMDALSATFREGAAVTQSVATAEERHASEVQRLRSLLAAGAISQQTYARAVDKSETQLRQASAASRGLGSATRAAASGVDVLSGKLNTLIAINAAQLFGSVASAASQAIRSFYGMAEAQSAVIDRGSDLASRLGLTYGELAGLTAIGEQVDVSMESIAKAATKADVAFAKAAGGSAVARKAFDVVGLSLDELQGKTAAERFNAIAVAIAKLPTPAERARAAIGLFGKSGAELLPMFEGGAGAIEQATADAQRFGAALTNDQAKSVNEMRDAFVRAGQAIQGVIGQVVSTLAPALKATADTFTNLVGDIGGATIGQVIGEQMIRGAEFLAAVGDSMVASVGDVWAYVAQVGQSWAATFRMGSQIASVFAGVGRTLASAFQSIVLGFSTIVERILSAAKSLADLVPGMSSDTLDAAVAGARAFNAELGKSARDNAAAAAQNFDAATSPQGVAEYARGPLASALGEALAEARRNAAAPSVAPRQTVEPAQSGLAESRQPLRGTDSRSREGIAEMFRLMRGGDDVQQEQLDVLMEINDKLGGQDVEETLMFSGA